MFEMELLNSTSLKDGECYGIAYSRMILRPWLGETFTSSAGWGVGAAGVADEVATVLGAVLASEEVLSDLEALMRLLMRK